MKRIGLVLIAIACTTITSISQNPEIIKSALSEGQVVVDTVYSKGLETNLLGDSPDRKVYVYLPPGYEESPDIKYPVVYLLVVWDAGADYYFGGSDDPTFDVKQLMDGLISQSKVSPMIIVSPDTRNKYLGCYFANSSVAGNWEDFLVEELVHYVDSKYRTLLQAESRGIAGYSIGGYGAIKMAMKHPDIFSSLFGLSSGPINLAKPTENPYYKDFVIQVVESGCEDFSSLGRTVQRICAEAVAFAPNPAMPCLGEFLYTAEGVFIDSVWQKYLLHDITTMLPLHKENMLQLRAIHLEAGTEGDVPYEQTIRFCDTLAALGITHELDSFPGNHVNMRVERFEKSLLPFFSRSLSKNMLTDTVFIPDTAFLYALIDKGVDTNEDGLISYVEAENVTTLKTCHIRSDEPWCAGCPVISDFTGIEAFVNLDTLFCPCAGLEHLNLSNLLKLKYLDCQGNGLNSLIIAGCIELTDLWCSNNQITNLDLSELTKLKNLVCNGNLINSLDISNSKDLTNLQCGGNQISNLDFSNNTALRKIFASANGLLSLNVSGLDSLKLLDVSDNDLVSLDISDNINLEDLIISDNPNLHEVCVWAAPFYMENVNVTWWQCPNACFEADCNGECDESTRDFELYHKLCSIHPNPTYAMVNIEAIHQGQFHIEITSISGQQILNEEFHGTSQHIDLSSFNPGVYFITIRSNDFVTTKKIIKL